MNEKQGIYASPSSFSSPKMHISTHFHCYGPSYTYKDYFKQDRKSTRLNSSHDQISYAVFCLKKKKNRHRVIQDLTCETEACRCKPFRMCRPSLFIVCALYSSRGERYGIRCRVSSTRSDMSCS